MSLQASSTITRLDLGLSVDEFDARMDRNGFIGHRVLPIVQRAKPTGDFAKRTLESVLQNHRTDRNPGGEYQRSSSSWTTDSYSTTERAHEATLDDRTTRRYDDIVDAEFWETERVIDIVLRSYEVACAAAIFNATTWAAATTAITNEWDDSANATPINDIEAARELIVLAFGSEPNTLVVNRKVFRNLRNVAQIVDRVKNQGFVDVQQGNLTEAQIASALDIDQIVVAGGLENTANEADARAVSRIWSGEYAMLCKVPMSGDPGEAGLGRTVMWSEEGATDGERPGVIVEQYREDARRGDVIRGRTDDQLKVMFVAAGHLLSNITT